MPLNICRTHLIRTDKSSQAQQFYAQKTLNSMFPCSFALAKRTKKRGLQLKRIIANEEVCMGCGLCEVYCTVQHSKSKDIVKAYNKEKPRPISRVRLEVNKPVYFAIQCRHCEDAPCVTACLSGAMTTDEETGLVTHNKEKCMGCWACVMVCPYGDFN